MIQTISEVGIAGLAIDTVEDIKILFDQIPLNQVSVSMTLNIAILPLLAFYIVAAEEQGIKAEQLSGCIQDTTLNKYIVENKQLYSAEYLLAIFECVQKKMPKFNAIHIPSLPIYQAKTTVAIELAYTLTNGLEYIKSGLNAGMKIDNIAPRLTFSFGIGMNHFVEIAKLRAAKMIWAKLIKQFNPKNPKSLALQIHSETSEKGLTNQELFNNVTRTCIEAAAAVFGGTQSLQTNLLEMTNESELSTRIAENTQRYLQEETKITKTVDPWGGSYYLESLTYEITQTTWKHIEEIEKYGGIRKAIESGLLKLKEEKVAAERKTINNHSIFQDQLKRLNQVKATRNFENVQISLNKIKANTQNERSVLFELIIAAARNRATIEEISDALGYC
jgi:methylmalonyl-CoA mutase